MPKYVEQTGLINEFPKKTDYFLGAETPIVFEERIASGDWTKYLPTGEKQRFIFDTSSCVTFSALNVIEAQLKWMLKNNKLPLTTIQFLEQAGYLKGEEFNFSDRFTAIMSGTTDKGNSLVKVWDSIRKDGLLPESDLPFGGTTFAEYHNAKEITPAMKTKAKKILEYFSFMYDWVAYDGEFGFTKAEIDASKKILKHVPLHMGVPVPATHAVTMYYMNDEKYGRFDHYEPFMRDEKIKYKPVQFALRGVVGIKAKEPEKPMEKPTFKFTTLPKKGETSSAVKSLQQYLIYFGYMKKGLDTGYFGDITQDALNTFVVSTLNK